MDHLEVYRAYRRLFLADDGTLKPDGEIIMRDLEKLTGWMVTSLPTSKDGTTDPYRACAELAKRKVFAEVKKRLFAPLENLKRNVEK